MPTLRLAGCALLLSLPLASRAQSAEALPRYYVGLSAYSGTYQVLGGNYLEGTTVPVQLTVGYQLRPRLAVQLGAAYSGNSYDYAGTGRYYSSPAYLAPFFYYDYADHTTRRNTSVALLARYTLTRQPAHHLQFDLLGGVGLEVQKYNYSEVRTDSDSARTVSKTNYSDRRYTGKEVLLMAGIGTRYRFGQRLEAVLDVTFGKSLWGELTNSRLTSTTALGLRYRFGRR
jgi:hypothetical protein